MKQIFFFLFLVISVCTRAEEEYLVKVNPKECLKCYFAQEALNRLAGDGAKIKLVFSKRQNLNVERFISVNLPGLNSEIKAIVSDSIYDNINNRNLSELYKITDNDSMVFQCEIRNIWKYLGGIKRNNKTTKCQIPDTIQTIVNLLDYNGNEYALLDPMQQEFFVFSNKGNLIDQITPADFSVKELLFFIDNDSLTYNLYKEIKAPLEQFGRSKTDLRGFSMNDDDNMIYLLISVPYPIRDNNGEILVYHKNVIVEYNIDKQLMNFIKLSEKIVPDGLFVNVNDFEYIPDPGLFLFPVSNSKYSITGDYYILGGEKREDNIMYANRLIEYDLHKLYQQDTLPKQLIPSFFDEYVYFQYSNMLFNFVTNDTLLTPFKNNRYTFDQQSMTFDYDYAIEDFFMGDKHAYCIYTDRDLNFYYSISDPDTAKCYKSTLLDIKKSELKSGFKFISKDSFIYMNNNNEIIQYNL